MIHRRALMLLLTVATIVAAGLIFATSKFQGAAAVQGAVLLSLAAALLPRKEASPSLRVLGALTDARWRLHLYLNANAEMIVGEDVDVRLTPDNDGDGNADRGLGVFAERDIAKGELIGRYTGVLRTGMDIHMQMARHAKTRRRSEQQSHEEEGEGGQQKYAEKEEQNGRYLFALTNGLYVDSEDPAVGNFCRYINHGPTASDNGDGGVQPNGDGHHANCRSKSAWHFDSLLSAVVVEAKRPIRQGEELLIDYGDDYDWGGETPTPPVVAKAFGAAGEAAISSPAGSSQKPVISSPVAGGERVLKP
jgi:hypothetical protein